MDNMYHMKKIITIVMLDPTMHANLDSEGVLVWLQLVLWEGERRKRVLASINNDT